MQTNNSIQIHRDKTSVNRKKRAKDNPKKTYKIIPIHSKGEDTSKLSRKQLLLDISSYRIMLQGSSRKVKLAQLFIYKSQRKSFYKTSNDLQTINEKKNNLLNVFGNIKNQLF